MRAAGAEVVPLRFTPYGEALREYVDDLRRIVTRKARTVESDSAGNSGQKHLECAAERVGKENGDVESRRFA